MRVRTSGHPPDWANFYLENRRAFLACATAWCGNADDAADLIQEAFLRQLGRKEVPENARAYVLRSIRNLAIDRKRASRPTDSLTVDAAATIADSTSDHDTPGFRVRLIVALEQLPIQQREAVLLRAVAGLTIAETAAVLEKPSGSIASAYARGIDELQRILNSEWTDECRESGKCPRRPVHRGAECGA